MFRSSTLVFALVGVAMMSGAALAQQSGGRGGDGGGRGGDGAGGADPGDAISVLISAATVPGGPNRLRKPRGRADSNRNECSERLRRGNHSDGGWSNQLCNND